MQTNAYQGNNGEVYDLDILLNQFSVSLRNHSRRVAVCSAIIAEQASAFNSYYEIPKGSSLSAIAHMGGTCHDIGKLMLPAVEIKCEDYMMHPAIGAEFLEKYKHELLGNETLAQMVLDIVRYHHERADGKGFPNGIMGNGIPFMAGICSAADKLDHDAYLANVQGKNEDGVFRALKAQKGRLFCECIWICIERAWPSLMEKYAAWNCLTDKY